MEGPAFRSNNKSLSAALGRTHLLRSNASPSPQNPTVQKHHRRSVALVPSGMMSVRPPTRHPNRRIGESRTNDAVAFVILSGLLGPAISVSHGSRHGVGSPDPSRASVMPLLSFPSPERNCVGLRPHSPRPFFMIRPVRRCGAHSAVGRTRRCLLGC